jgi:hypothetical protein
VDPAPLTAVVLVRDDPRIFDHIAHTVPATNPAIQGSVYLGD